MSEDVTIREIEVLKLSPGDCVVYRTPHTLSEETRDKIIGMLISMFPNNQVLIVDGGDSLGVIRK